MKNSGLLATGAKLFNLSAIRMIAYAEIYVAGSAGFMNTAGLLAAGAYRSYIAIAFGMITDAYVIKAKRASLVLIALCVTAGAGLSFGFGFVAFGVVTYANVFLALLALSVIFALFVTSGADLQYVV